MQTLPPQPRQLDENGTLGAARIPVVCYCRAPEATDLRSCISAPQSPRIRRQTLHTDKYQAIDEENQVADCIHLVLGDLDAGSFGGR